MDKIIEVLSRMNSIIKKIGFDVPNVYKECKDIDKLIDKIK